MSEAERWPGVIHQWAMVNRALTNEEHDRVYELAKTMPIADALRRVARDDDTVTSGD